MKILVQISRVLVGLLFIFSGFIKSNDPLGFSYKLDEYFSVFASDLSAKQDSLSIAMGKGSDFSVSNIQLNKQNSQHQLSWHVHVDTSKSVNEKGDVIDVNVVSNLEVSLDGNPIFKESFINGDSNTILYQAILKASVLDNLVCNEEILITGFQEIDKKVALDLERFVKSDSIFVDFFNSLKPMALWLAIFLVVLEIILGLALLIGFMPKTTTFSLLIIIIMFTFLTWYSAAYNKVTDCGCFGDAIPLKPFQSFFKDIILLFFILILFLWKRYINALFTKRVARNLIGLSFLFCSAFSIWCWYDLPLLNFLKFKVGNDIEALMQIPAGGRQNDHILRKFLYNNEQGEEVEIAYDSETNQWIPEKNVNWTYISYLGEEIIAEADKAPIHDFRIDDKNGINHVPSFFADNTYKILLISHDLDLFRNRAIDGVNDLAQFCEKNNLGFWALTSNGVEKSELFEDENHLNFKFYFGDNTNLKSIIRSNPGVLLIKNSTVVKTWPSTRLPKPINLEKLIANE
ncbi:MAG: hypothetical protein CNE98_00790 [Bacteroidetes bacterium MED-G17]|nr:MAG: hypothetical protein CBB99_05755 [Bacteroidetes bacterium TMED39]PDH53627.1 MAG: hypothetical protein CNE98_00790 [Bacteroidetes bacterium MED-G17]|tara:strand:- start:25164 stop:26711 length:1548 start_codon:yes stop_codon:yes gene_type:complete